MYNPRRRNGEEHCKDEKGHNRILINGMEYKCLIEMLYFKISDIDSFITKRQSYAYVYVRVLMKYHSTLVTLKDFDLEHSFLCK